MAADVLAVILGGRVIGEIERLPVGRLRFRMREPESAALQQLLMSCLK